LSRLARVRFEGVRETWRSQAVPTADGIRLATVLPFLRTGSEVSVSFVSGSSRVLSRGIVREVSIEPRQPDGIPRLAVNVQFPRENEPDYLPMDAGEEITAVESPHARARIAALRPNDLPSTHAPGGHPPVEVRALLPRSRRRPLRSHGRPRPRTSPRRLPGSPAQLALRVGIYTLAGLALVAAGTALAHWSTSHKATPSTPAAGLAVRPTTAPPPRTTRIEPPPQRVPIADDTSTAPRTTRTEPPPQRSVPIADDTSTAPGTTRTEPPPQRSVPVVDIAREPRPSSTAADPLTGLPPLPPGTPGPHFIYRAPDGHAVAAAEPDSELVVEVPFAGSAEGARHYALAQPRGVAITLPRARSVLPLGRHAVFNEGFSLCLDSRAGAGRNPGAFHVRLSYTRAARTGGGRRHGPRAGSSPSGRGNQLTWHSSSRSCSSSVPTTPPGAS
jgi:hypothetical protein